MALTASKYSLAFVVIAALQICGGAVVMCEAADDTEAATQTWTSGNCTCTLDDATGVFTVSGTGAMQDQYQSPPWQSVKGSITSVVVQSGVTKIGVNCFNYCTSLASVTISDTVTTIGANAFQGCTSLASITLGNSVTSIGSGAFQGSSIQSITIPASVTTIGGNTFSSCTSVTSIIFEATSWNIQSISSSAFSLGTQDSPVTATVYSPGNVADGQLDAYKGSYTTLTYIDLNPTVTITVNDPTYGSVSVNSLTVPYGTPIGIDTQTGLFTVGTTAVTATPSPDTAQYTYEFRSWSWVPNLDAVTEDITATATFDRYTNNCTVTVAVNDSNYGSVDVSSFTVNYGTAISAAANVLTVGSSTSTATPTTATAQYTYAFDSWSNVPAGGTVTEDFTVTANFSRSVNQYTVSVSVNDAAYGSVSVSSFTVDYGTAISAAANVLTVGSSSSTATPTTATAQYTYAFDSWSNVPAGGTVTEDFTVTANFSRSVNQYTVSVSVNDAAYGSVSVSSFTVDYGTAISSAAAVLTVGSSTSTATPAAATAQYTFAFDSWSGIPAGGTVTEDFTVTAVFARTVNQYTVTVTVNDSTYGSVDVSSITVDYGTAISSAAAVLTVGSSTSRATPASFAVFDSWSGVPAGGTVTGNVTVTAVFSVTFATGGIAYAGTGSGTDVTVMGLSGVPAAFTLVASVDYGGVTWTVTGIDAHAFDDVTLQDHRDPITTPTIGQHFVLHDGIYWLDGWHPNPHYIIGGAMLAVIPLLIIVCILIGALAFVGARRDI